MKVVLIGARADGYAHLVLENLQQFTDHEPVGFLDETPGMEGTTVLGLPVFGPPSEVCQALAAGAEGAVMAIGHGPARDRIAPPLTEAGLALPTIVCRGAVVAPSAHVGEGVFVGVNAVIGSGTYVGDLAIVLTLCCVGHHARIGRAVSMLGGSIIGGRATVGDRTLVGLGAHVLSDVAIGADATIGAGAMVTKDVPVGIRVAGVPARPLNDAPETTSPSLP